MADIDQSEKGWWCDVIGEDRALDTRRYQVLGIDFLGGSGTTTGPRAGQTNFPSISAYDQAEVLRRVLDHLEIARLAGIVGASYGGMVALAFAERFEPPCELLLARVDVTAGPNYQPASRVRPPAG